MSPGTLVHIGKIKVEKPRIKVIEYNNDQIEEKEMTSIADLTENRDKSTVTWVNIEGLHSVDLIEDLGKRFNLHPLVLEDVLHALKAAVLR